MALKNHHHPGINLVGEFQASGHTFVVTGSAYALANVVKLKYVASSITLAATDTSTFSVFDSSHTRQQYKVPSGSCVTYKGKFLTFHCETDMTGLVSLTNIPSSSYLPPSGSQLHYI